jgi:hypothetical protein
MKVIFLRPWPIQRYWSVFDQLCRNFFDIICLGKRQLVNWKIIQSLSTTAWKSVSVGLPWTEDDVTALGSATSASLLAIWRAMWTSDPRTTPGRRSLSHDMNHFHLNCGDDDRHWAILKQWSVTHKNIFRFKGTVSDLLGMSVNSPWEVQNVNHCSTGAPLTEHAAVFHYSKNGMQSFVIDHQRMKDGQKSGSSMCGLFSSQRTVCGTSNQSAIGIVFFANPRYWWEWQLSILAHSMGDVVHTFYISSNFFQGLNPPKLFHSKKDSINR